MAPVVFGGVSPRSLGDLLKGYGIMALVGEDCPDALFWWDGAFHLVVERPCDRLRSFEDAKRALTQSLRGPLVAWATQVGKSFKPTRGSSRGNVKRKDSVLKAPSGHDTLDPEMARWARAIAIPEAGKEETKAHPLFPSHGQEGSGDYFHQLEKAAEAAKESSDDLVWSLFAEGTPSLKRVLQSGYLFFPEPMKRYASGVKKWVQEHNAPVSPWCFLLAMRGAMLLRGSLRRLRWGRRSYPAFPFVFEGTTGNVELHLPTWTQERPRTLAEFEIQVRQFYARLSGSGFAATAAEFRAAVAGRSAGAAFDSFHRFVLERRRPGQRERMSQGIPRGLTRVGGVGEKSGVLRLMLAPLAETAWLDQFATDRPRARRALVEEAVHRVVEKPGLGSYRGLLEALWEANRAVVLPGAVRRDLEEIGQTPRPLPPLPARLWEKALEDGLSAISAYRLGRALGSILGVRLRDGGGVGPILEHMLPLKYDWGGSRWKIPEPERSRPNRWSGLEPLGDFRALFWSRWLDSADLDRLPFAARRCAPLADVVALLRGEVELKEVCRLAGLFALLDWEQAQETHADQEERGDEYMLPVPPAYAALRLWLHLSIRPGPNGRPPRDGRIARLIALGSRVHVEQATQLALRHLRVHGLPWHDQPRPTGKAVAYVRPTPSDQEAARMVLAVTIPISEQDTHDLARRFWVPIDSTRGGIT